MGSSVRVRLDRDLYERLQKAAEARGYSGVDEFIGHVLEKAAGDAGESETREAVRERLRGLGYIE